MIIKMRFDMKESKLRSLPRCKVGRGAIMDLKGNELPFRWSHFDGVDSFTVVKPMLSSVLVKGNNFITDDLNTIQSMLFW